MSDKIEKKEQAGLPAIQASPQELALVQGNLAALTPEQRLAFYKSTCESLNLNPLTQPFAYITLNGKLTLYARKDAADQLRSSRRVSLSIVSRESVEGVYVVTARATMPDGRTDESIGALPLPKDPAERANAIMKAETKAKRRVTLSICGLGMLDESELDTMPRSAYTVEVEVQTPRTPPWKRPPVKEIAPAPEPAPTQPAPPATTAQPSQPPVDRLAEARAQCLAIYATAPDVLKDRLLELAEDQEAGCSDQGIADAMIEQLRNHKMRLSTLNVGMFTAAVCGLEG